MYAREEAAPERVYDVLGKQKYHIVGRHSAVKRCHWLYEALVHGRWCYKHKFYGVPSHRCIQMTPSVIYCTMRCLYCWRVQPDDVGEKWNELSPHAWDEPEVIVEGAIAEQRRILSGYKARVLSGEIPREMYEEALKPSHAAISLAGEPTLYPRIGELVAEFRRRGFTTFVVTNGTLPEVLEKMETLPSQLYVTLPAPRKEIFSRVNRPMVPDAWERLLRTLDLLPSLNTRKAIRLTLVKGLNMVDPDSYAKLIERASPTYVEAKAYMHVGMSVHRLTRSAMPDHGEVKAFAERIAERLGMPIIAEAPESRVVLLSHLKKPLKVVP